MALNTAAGSTSPTPLTRLSRFSFKSNASASKVTTPSGRANLTSTAWSTPLVSVILAVILFTCCARNVKFVAPKFASKLVRLGSFQRPQTCPSITGEFSKTKNSKALFCFSSFNAGIITLGLIEL